MIVVWMKKYSPFLSIFLAIFSISVKINIISCIKEKNTLQCARIGKSYTLNTKTIFLERNDCYFTDFGKSVILGFKVLNKTLVSVFLERLRDRSV